MKLNKIFDEITKDYVNRITGQKASRLVLGRVEHNCVFVTIDGIKGYVIPDCSFPFALERLNPNLLNDAQSLIDDKGYSDAVMTNELQELDTVAGKKKKVAVKFSAGDYCVWADRELLKNFDLAVCTFKVNVGTKLSPILVYEFEKVAGVVLPVRV